MKSTPCRLCILHYSSSSQEMTTSLPIERLSNSATSGEGRSASSTTWRADSAGTGFLNPSWTGTRYFFCLQPSYETSINSSWEGLTWRSLDSKQQAASRRLSSGSSLCQQSGSGHQGSMCWISIHATTLMLMCSRMTLDNTNNLWPWSCVLPQVALWGKGFFMRLFGDIICAVNTFH